MEFTAAGMAVAKFSPAAKEACKNGGSFPASASLDRKPRHGGGVRDSAILALTFPR